VKADPASEGTEESHPVPGSPEPDEVNPESGNTRALHPLAWLVSLALAGAGLAMARSWILLALAATLLGILALRAERKSPRAEAPLLALALIVFLAHVLFAGKNFRAALAPSAAIAWRLLALLYLLRWAARSALGPIARWLMAKKPPSRPRILLVLVESARLTAGLLPLALREAGQHVQALRGRGIRPGRGLQGIARYLLAWFLPFLGTMLRIGDAYADALTARGYQLGHARRAGLPLHWGIREWAAVVGSATGAAWFLRVL
jgi:energy-coupling factor transporter transmembrane protein EcfT